MQNRTATLLYLPQRAIALLRDKGDRSNSLIIRTYAKTLNNVGAIRESPLHILHKPICVSPSNEKSVLAVIRYLLLPLALQHRTGANSTKS